ncbi:hypothetical protein NDI56_04975 [Haloarcula sp. S1CR25-12]|uniref:Major facilitator superfamily (MFS) profile domain-containing protein n=1 Tax=Haloarcula saliterrae TaxID=2950534 RepID=A0ABU2F8X9_9EURY|nr:hypothetical protein [Haloarcula sp. S1CR25-12]MDS0258743.1 hypothetical protein [Haloarcula sp. S1CR25-12]
MVPSIIRVSLGVALGVALAVLSLLVLLYSLIIAQQILLGMLFVAAIWLVYLLLLLVVTLRERSEHDG